MNAHALRDRNYRTSPRAMHFSSCRMIAALLVGVLLSAQLSRYHALPDCCALGFGDIQPNNDSDSSVCVRNAEDCCTSTYLNLLSDIVLSELDEYIPKEFRDGIDSTLSKVDKLIEYFSEHFFERDIIHVLVTTSTSQISNESENSVINLTDMLSSEIADQAVCETITSKFTSLVVKITEAYYSGEEISEEDRQCISRATRSKIDNDSLMQIASGLVELFKYTLRAVHKIQDFIESQTNRTEGANVSTACVNGFIEAAFCRQCVERTPPICMLTCNALVRGCYSPYYTILNGQFQELWTEIKRLTLDINSTVHRVLNHTSKLGEFSKLLADIESNCGLTTRGTTRKEKSSVGIPLPVLEPLMDITGPFMYSEGDLKICRVKTDDNTCFEATEGPQDLQCNLKDEAQLKNGTYTSDPGKLELTTSECDCFDGTEFTSDDETMQTFEGNDIHDQGANPVFQPPLNVTDLERQQSEIEQQQGNPVRDFLSSTAYTELSKPQETADGGSICTAGTAGPTEAGSMTVASLTALFLAFVVAIFTP